MKIKLYRWLCLVTAFVGNTLPDLEMSDSLDFELKGKYEDDYTCEDWMYVFKYNLKYIKLQIKLMVK